MTNQTTEQSSREAFEEWAIRRYDWWKIERAVLIARHTGGEYRTMNLRDAFAAWQARDTEVAALKAEIADYEEVMQDKRRLARAIDVALHGEIGAAKQASLCDLVGPAEALRLELDALKAEIERLKASADALADAGKDVVWRWDSPSWKDLPHTADYIHRLRQALSAYAAVKGGA